MDVINKILHTPPRRLVKQAWYKMNYHGYRSLEKHYDRRVSGYPNLKPKHQGLTLFLEREWLSESCDAGTIQMFRYLSERYCAHEFDLLGSGWVSYGFVENGKGFLGQRCKPLVLRRDPGTEQWLQKVVRPVDLKGAREIYRLVSEKYQPIDWQKDGKTGYRWGADNYYYSPAVWAKEPASDIKVPWELSRLQHIPQLAVAAMLIPDQKDRLVREIQDQCLDFMAQNPIRRGVNWMCVMDVAIRAANLSLGLNILKAQDAVLDPRFENLMIAWLQEICAFIRHHLEWSEILRGNHYLSDVCGLLFAAAALPQSKQRSVWLRFASEQIQKEILLQFHADGSNFEGSVPYHRLSAEMSAFSLALLAKLEKQGICRVSSTAADRIWRAGAFCEAMRNPHGDMLQIGDNDSGRFFHLSPIGELLTSRQAMDRYDQLEQCAAPDPYFDEDLNCPDATLAAIGGLFGQPLRWGKKDCALERCLIKGICGTKIQTVVAPSTITTVTEQKTDALAYRCKWDLKFPGEPLTVGLRLTCWPDFGVYLYRSNRMVLCVNGCSNGQRGHNGHSHNDRLSFELWIDNRPITVDPGTFVYTASLGWRNYFRSVECHAVVNDGTTQNEIIGPFAMQSNTNVRLLELTENSIRLECVSQKHRQRRSIVIEEQRIQIEDESDKPVSPPDIVSSWVCAGYGKLLRRGKKSRALSNGYINERGERVVFDI